MYAHRAPADTQAVRPASRFVIAAALVAGVAAAHPAWADPPLSSLPRMPVCGDQSAGPVQLKCRDFVPIPDVQVFQVPGQGPIDLTFNVGLRIDTQAGGFVFGLSNLIGFLPVRGPEQGAGTR